MQDRYAGDVGDFLKLGLLSWLRAPARAAKDSTPLSLGIVWYLTADESHNKDGKHIDYLKPDSPVGRVLRPIDPTVYDALGQLVAAGPRTVARLEACGALATDTVSFAERLVLSDFGPTDREGRLECRTAWLSRAVHAVESCDLVCLDPDNGIRRDDHSVGPHRNRSEKHAYMSEVAAFAGVTRSLVVYHHADRSGPVDVQAQRRLDDLAEGLSSESTDEGANRAPLAAVRTSRGSARLFLVCPSEHHRTRLTSRLAALEAGPTGSEFAVLWWQG